MAGTTSARSKQKLAAFVRNGEWRDARKECQKMTKANPFDPEVWFMLGSVNVRLGRYEDAISSYHSVLRLTSGRHAETHYNLGVSYQKLDRLEQAIASYQEALRLNPSFSAAYSNAATIYERLGRPIHALRYYIEASHLSSKPDQSSNISRITSNAENWAEAEKVLADLAQKRPDDPRIYTYLGELHWAQGHWAEAENHYRTALELDHTLEDAWIGLGNTLQDNGNYAESGHCYECALALNPEHHAAHYNLGALYLRQMKLAEAMCQFDIAIRYRPEFVEAHWHKAFVCLLTGDYTQGWQEYEWRHKRKDNIKRIFTQPQWDGSALDGRTILVHDEQGLGDTFQFVRYLQLVKARGGRVIFECHRGLRAVLNGCEGYDQIVERTSLHDAPEVEFDVHVPLMSLPGILGTSLDNIPSDTPYIRPDPARVEKWRERLREDRGFKIGIAWAGSAKHTNEVSRSCPLAEFAALAQVPQVTLYSLQKGEGAKQADALASRMQLVRLDKELDQEAPFVDTAAAIVNMDLIVTIDTSIAHLAGALGQPVWALICTMPDWRWLLDRTDSPWYPNMRLFRQRAAGDWKPVFEELIQQLTLTPQ